MRIFITFLSLVFLFPSTQGRATQSFNFEEERQALTTPQLQNPDRRYVKISITGRQKEEFLEALATTCTPNKMGPNGSHSFHKKKVGSRLAWVYDFQNFQSTCSRFFCFL